MKSKHLSKTSPLLFAILLSLASSSAFAAPKRNAPKRLPIHQPEQITSETDPILYFAVSRDGKKMVYVSDQKDGG